MKRMKKIIAVWVLFAMLIATLASCAGTAGKPEETNVPKLDAPKNLTVSESGLISWSPVNNATGYTVTVGSVTVEVSGTTYQATETDKDFNFSVAAKAAGYTDSEAARGTYHAVVTPPLPGTVVSVAVKGKSEVCAGHTVTLSATVTGTEDTVVLWSIETGGEYATIDPISGVLTAKSDIDGDRIIKVKALSLADETAYGTRTITIVSRPVLTQEMLNRLAAQTKLAFEGMLDIQVYNFGLYDTLVSTSTVRVGTAMDGTNWYASYQDGATGLDANLYYKNHNGLACQVGVSFMNDEEFAPMLDDDGNGISWTDAGLYNNFAGLTVDDFRFNDETWRYEYVGADKTLMKRMLASANPYDFIPKSLALILHEGQIMGIFSVSEDDYTVAAGYRSVLELTVAVNYGETVEVPTISKFVHDPVHDNLAEALERMQALESYTTDLKLTTASNTGYSVSGYTETVTPDNCYFRPYRVTDVGGEEVKNYSGEDYGFLKFGEADYNSYLKNDSGYVASRAFAKDFSNAKPTFAFAPEIFTYYYINEETGATTYYVNDVMCPVASTFYYGIGNDFQLYGIFASRYLTAGSEGSFTPYVTVKDGYIIDAGFYFNLGIMYGIAQITYGDFGEATLPEGTEVVFDKRENPTAWNDLTIIRRGTGDTLADDVEVNAHDYFAEFFGSEDVAAEVPFFNAVLGDTYGFGLSTFYKRTGSGSTSPAVCLYYDVPLDTDYTLTSSLKAIDDYLQRLGFEKNRNGEYSNGSMIVVPTDSSLDLVVYVLRGSF